MMSMVPLPVKGRCSIWVAASNRGVSTAERRVPLLESVLDAVLPHCRLEGDGLGRKMAAGVDLCADALQRACAHQFQAEIDQTLVGREEVGIHEAHAIGETHHLGFEFICWIGLQRQPDLGRVLAGSESPVSSRRFAHWGPQ